MSSDGVSLTIELRSLRPGETIVHLRGELDMASAPQVEAAIRDLHARGRVPAAVDLSQLSFVDCAGLHAVLEARARAAVTGSPFEVVLGEGCARHLAEVAGAVEHLCGGRASEPADGRAQGGFQRVDSPRNPRTGRRKGTGALSPG